MPRVVWTPAVIKFDSTVRQRDTPLFYLYRLLPRIFTNCARRFSAEISLACDHCLRGSVGHKTIYANNNSGPPPGKQTFLLAFTITSKASSRGLVTDNDAKRKTFPAAADEARNLTVHRAPCLRCEARAVCAAKLSSIAKFRWRARSRPRSGHSTEGQHRETREVVLGQRSATERRIVGL